MSHVTSAGEILSKDTILGFDMEWNVPFVRGVSPPPVDTLQLASRKQCFIFKFLTCAKKRTYKAKEELKCYNDLSH